MFDIDAVSKRYFSIKINGSAIEVEPPKRKTLKKLMKLSKNTSEESIDDLYDEVRSLLNKNRTGYVVPEEWVDDLDLDQLISLLSAFFAWIGQVRKDPN